MVNGHGCAGRQFKFIQQAIALCIPAVGESYDYAKAAISLECLNSFPWPKDCVQIHQTLFPPQGWDQGMRLYYVLGPCLVHWLKRYPYNIVIIIIEVLLCTSESFLPFSIVLDHWFLSSSCDSIVVLKQTKVPSSFSQQLRYAFTPIHC